MGVSVPFRRAALPRFAIVISNVISVDNVCEGWNDHTNVRICCKFRIGLLEVSLRGLEPEQLKAGVKPGLINLARTLSFLGLVTINISI